MTEQFYVVWKGNDELLRTHLPKTLAQAYVFCVRLEKHEQKVVCITEDKKPGRPWNFGDPRVTEIFNWRD